MTAKLAARWLRWLFPPRCQACGQVGADALCTACLAAIPLPLLPRCAECGYWFDPLAREVRHCADCRAARARDRLLARSAGFHEGSLRRLVMRLKYQRRRGAAAALGTVTRRWLGVDHEAVTALGFGGDAVLVPVPLHQRRQRWRGFNQARLLAEQVADTTGCEVCDALTRVRATRPQVGLRGADRERNVKGAFVAAVQEFDAEVSYVLIDDVYTTGATLRECARTLRAAGALRVSALTVARPARDDLVILARRYTKDWSG